MAIFKCKICGGSLEIKTGESIATCEYCGTKQTLPRLDDERKANLYDRANHFRRNNDYDKAMGIYETILNEDTTDAEAYWSILLCKYGIEYVEDPVNHKHLPTVNRAQYTSIFDDEDYKSALQYADSSQREIYETEAEEINEIQKGILDISAKEEPFDVFICYKETDASGRRTKDSVLATELYHELTRDGFKVFFSRITLEDKLGTAYEPYIFAALNSAKVMVVVGTKPEHFNAVWVRNEWSRYLSLIKNGAKKTLIPAYRDMDPYDLPEEFSHLQAQDMSKLGFMQDLIRGIKKIVGAQEPKTAVVKEKVVTAGNAGTAPLIKRIFMFLEDGDFIEADEYCEKVLDIDPECAEAYLGKLMAELSVNKREQLADCDEPFDNNSNYQKALRFADKSLADELKGYIKHINDRNENNRLSSLYNNAVNTMNLAKTEQEYKNAASKFSKISGYKDAENLAEECLNKAEVCRKDAIYDSAKALMNVGTVFGYENAIKMFQRIPGWKDADEQIEICNKKITEIKEKEEKTAKKIKKIVAISAPIICAIIAFIILLNTVIIPSANYNKGMELLESGDYDKAIEVFLSLGDYKDVSDKQAFCYYNKGIKLLESGDYDKAIGAFFAAGDYKDAVGKRAEYLINRNRETISGGSSHIVGLKSDGTVVATGRNGDGQCDVSDWKDIVAISAGDYHTVGLKSDGTVVATGDNDYGQCDVSGWRDIVAISARFDHTVGLKSNGTVVATGLNNEGQCNVSGWKGIIAISAGYDHTVGLKSDGTVVATGSNGNGKCNVSDWKDIVAISAGDNHTVGLKSNGTVVATGWNGDGECDVSDWRDIVAISTGYDHTVGLKSDGTVVATGNNKYGQCDVSDRKDIVAISAGLDHTVGLKSDGTVVATDYSEYRRSHCDVSGWKDIMLP